MKNTIIEKAKEIRKLIIKSTTKAGSGHPTSSLSATDVMSVLFFGGYFDADFENPENPDNDRLIFSKGHASPLLYSLYTAKGYLPEEELMTLRQFDSVIEGHPTMRFKYTEAATGSLGQGLGVGLGLALNSKMESKKNNKKEYKTWVLLGDSEMAEGSVWEAMQLACYYSLNNLIAIVDMNRLGQRGETMYGHDIEDLAEKAVAFGWETVVVDGHDVSAIIEGFDSVLKTPEEPERPKMIIAQTIKGKGVSFLEDKDNWHGKTLDDKQSKQAIAEIEKA